MLKKSKLAVKRQALHRIKIDRKLIIVSSIAVIIGLSWSVKGRLVSPANLTPAAHAFLVQYPSQDNKEKPAPATIESEPVILKPTGFEPKAFSRSATPFVLSIHNQTRDFDLSFELLREDGRKLQNLKGPKGAVRNMKLIDLPPGNYLLKEVSHPEWTCRITLTP